MELTPLVKSHNGIHRITFAESNFDTIDYIHALIKVLNDNQVPFLHQPVLTFSTPRKNTPLKIGKKPSQHVSEPKIRKHNEENPSSK